MKAVILESYVMEEGDLDWSGVKALVPDTTSYVRTGYADIAPRIGDAELVLINKCRIDEAVLAQCPNLKWVGIIATGTDNIDLEACRRHGVAVANVPGYSTYSVAQMTFALILAVTNRVEHYTQENRNERWAYNKDFCYWDTPLMELAGKTFGIMGLGNIGMKVANIARQFGMNICACTSKNSSNLPEWIQKVSKEGLLATSDILSLHCPLSDDTYHFINKESLEKMKDTAILVNTGRGQLVDEEAVAAALHEGSLGAYCADVMAQEPPSKENPLFGEPNAYLTPHIAWATYEARERLNKQVAANVKAFLEGNPINVVNK